MSAWERERERGGGEERRRGEREGRREGREKDEEEKAGIGHVEQGNADEEREGRGRGGEGLRRERLCHTRTQVDSSPLVPASPSLNDNRTLAGDEITCAHLHWHRAADEVTLSLGQATWEKTHTHTHILSWTPP